jgi:hypothetical protein
MDDALGGGLRRARPRDGDIDGTVQLLADGTACVLIRIGLYRCIADLAQLQLDVLAAERDPLHMALDQFSITTQGVDAIRLQVAAQRRAD